MTYMVTNYSTYFTKSDVAPALVLNVEQLERVTYLFPVTTHSSFTNPLIMCINFGRGVKL